MFPFQRNKNVSKMTFKLVSCYLFVIGFLQFFNINLNFLYLYFFIENDLNREIDRLVEVSTLQKRKISELEYANIGQIDKPEEDIPNEKGDMSRRPHSSDIVHSCCRKTNGITRSASDECDDDDVIFNNVWGIHPTKF